MFTLIIILHVLGTLEICSASIDVGRQLSEMRNIIKKQEREISQLKRETKLLRADMTACMVKSRKLQTVKDGFMNQKIVDGGDEERSLREKQLENLSISNAKVRNTRSTNNIIAFYAYLSHPIPNPTIHHTLVFDIVKTNLGGGYNKYSGVFSAPTSGVYVFIWTIYTGDRGKTKYRVYVNNDEVNYTLGETDEAADFDSDTGTTVVPLNTSDSVYIRAAATCTTYVMNFRDNNFRTTFTGWNLN